MESADRITFVLEYASRYSHELCSHCCLLCQVLSATIQGSRKGFARRPTATDHGRSNMPTSGLILVWVDCIALNTMGAADGLRLLYRCWSHADLHEWNRIYCRHLSLFGSISYGGKHLCPKRRRCWAPAGCSNNVQVVGNVLGDDHPRLRMSGPCTSAISLLQIWS